MSSESSWDELEKAVEPELDDIYIYTVTDSDHGRFLTLEIVEKCRMLFCQDQLIPDAFRAQLDPFSDDDLFRELLWLDDCLVKKTLFTVKSREIAWSNYHRTLLKKKSSLSQQLLATISRAAMQRILDENFRVPEILPTESEPISEDDKDIVEYIAGFAVYKIRKTTRRLKDSKHKSQKLLLIDAMINHGPCTNALINTKQRGGLLSVVDALVPVFTEFEQTVRQQTCSSNTSTNDMVHILCNKDKISKVLKILLEDTLPSASQDMVDEIYLELIRTYVVTRINGYCRQLMENLRKETHTQKAQKALRKTLKLSTATVQGED